MNIAVFNYSWPFKVYTRDLVNSFADKGHTVHLFARETDFGYVKAPRSSRIQTHMVALGDEAKERIAAAMRPRLTARGLETADPNGFEYSLVRFESLLPCMADIVHSTVPDLDLGLGMEKGGLLWAAAWHAKSGKPYLYYSLELFAPDTPALEKYQHIKAMLSLEGAAHAGAAGTIVQDKDRAEYLFHYNRAPMKNVCYFPISVKPFAPAEKEKARFGKKLLLNFGWITARMSESELLCLYTVLPEDYMLCFHMHKEQKILQGLKERYGLPRMRVSTTDLDDAGIAALISSARVGLCWYLPEDMNSALTAFSSEKLALYLRHGIPVIVNANSNFGKLFAQFRCGEALCDVAELPKAIAKIEADYDAYSTAAHAAYERFYNHDLNFERMYSQFVQAGIIQEGGAS